MDDSAWGIATASFTLQSNLLQAFVRTGVLTPADALDVVALARGVPPIAPTLRPL